MNDRKQPAENTAQPGPQPVVDALILAGGQGSRLGGQDKGLLTVAGQNFAQVLTDLLRPHCRKVLISCNRNPQIYQQIADGIVHDETPEYAGPLAGLYAGALNSDADFLLVSPCDTPALNQRYPQRMLAGLGRSFNLQVAFDGIRRQSLHILAPRTQLLTAGDYLARGERSMKGWLLQVAASEVDFSDCPEIFLNINTANELDTWIQTKQELAQPS